MSTQILQTKLYVPVSRDGSEQHVHRQRLLVMLNAGLTRKLTLVCAPAGFGKSTLLSAWTNQHDAQRVAWLSLDDSDNDPVRFWMHFVAALQSADSTTGSAIGSTTTTLLQSPQLLPIEALLTPLLNDLASYPDQIVVVLDDYHAITNTEIHKGIFFLLDRLPPQLHIILSSRADPPWPLARLRGQNQLNELRTDDLRFTPEEVATFWQEVMQLDLSMAEVGALDTRTEGWIAGLQLVGLSLRGTTDRARFITAFSGTNRYIVDYLVEEVLARQPDDVQRFLLQTSILERLCGPLCDAVVDTAGGSAPNGQATLEQLDHDNLFLIALDDERNWYRYHHLFAEVLQYRLRRSQADTVSYLHRRASKWYQQQAMLAEAINHALAAADFDEATALIERMGINHFALPQIQYAINAWMVTLPAEIVNRRPRLCLMHALILFVSENIPASLQRVADAEAAFHDTAYDRSGEAAGESIEESIGGEIATMRALVSAYNPEYPPKEAVVLGEHALATLHSTQPTWRSVAALALGMAYLRLNDLKAAEHMLAEANRNGQAAGNVYLVATATSHQVAMQRARGLLHLAMATCQDAWTWASQRASLIYPAFSGTYMNFAELYREKNELDVALPYAEQAVAFSHQVNDPSMFMISRLVLVRIKAAQCDWPAADALLQQIAQQREQHPSVIHADLVPALRAQLQLAEAEHLPGGGDVLAAAWAWAEDAAWEEGDLLSASRFFEYIYMYEHRRIARAQVFIAWGRFHAAPHLLHETLAYLQRQLPVAEAAGTRWYQVKIMLLQALAYHLLGELEQSKHALMQALRLAHPQGYIRLFIDEGEPLRQLMVHARAWIVEPLLIAYAEQLLAAFAPRISPRISPSTSLSTLPQAQLHGAATALNNPNPVEQLIEQLTERELEILRLVHEGLSNRELATTLIVSVGTIKKHLNNIFGKLGVSSRTQAIARARSLDLL